MAAAPSPLSDDRFRDHWVRVAARARSRINFGWWLSTFVPAFTVLSVVLACLVLLGRKFGLSPELLLAAGAIVALALGAVTYRIASRSFFDIPATLAELDRALSLNNALTCAELDVAKWPTPDLTAVEPTIRWREISLPLLFGGVLLIAAAYVPVVRDLSSHSLNPAAPPAWGETEQILEEIEESGVASPEALKRFEERLESLKAEPEDRWYDHATLEASESLRQDTERAKEELAKGVNSLNEALTRAQDAAKERDQGGSEELGAAAAKGKEARATLEKNLKELAEGNLPLADDLRSALEDAASATQELTPEQAKALHDRLKAAQQSLAKQQSKEGTPSPSGSQSGQGDGKGQKNPNGGNQGEGRPGKEGDGMTADTGNGSCPPGATCSGGVGRGPGTAPLEYKDTESPALASKPELIKGDPETRAGDRELRQIEKLQPEEERSIVGGGEAGTAQIEAGGDAVVRGDYTPDERRILESYFK